jgi:N-acetylglucosaminyldiphosphoundecaprenol N-acetyl-beta-D-mannosaminyltransferase
MGAPIKNKVSGIDFGEKLLSLAEKEGARVFLLGGEKGIADEAKRKITKKHPKINICGTHHGYFSCCENESICNLINESRAEILVVCRGFPLQEKFVVENKNSLKGVKVFACLGGALDVWSGRTKRAPECIQRINCEWLWRILNEPKRTKRFLSSLPALFRAIWN